MADELSELNFEQDLEEALGVEEARRWKIEKVGALQFYVELSSVKAPDEKFQARLLWDAYPGLASLKFRDPESGRLDLPSAWPIVRGFRPQNLDACVNWTSEGNNLHPEWKNDPSKKWNSTGNVVLKTLRTLQSEVDDYFGGRFKK
jgi:hypothetical protein